MTENKQFKLAIRQRMAETGEPYSVARHAVQSASGASDGPGPETAGGATAPGGQPDHVEPSGSDVPGVSAPVTGTVPVTSTAPAAGAAASGEPDWVAEYCAEGAAAEGVSVAEFRARHAADWAQPAPPAPEGAWPPGPGFPPHPDSLPPRPDDFPPHPGGVPGAAWPLGFGPHPGGGPAFGPPGAEHAEHWAEAMEEHAEHWTEAMEEHAEHWAEAMEEHAEHWAEAMEERADRAQEWADRMRDQADGDLPPHPVRFSHPESAGPWPPQSARLPGLSWLFPGESQPARGYPGRGGPQPWDEQPHDPHTWDERLRDPHTWDERLHSKPGRGPRPPRAPRPPRPPRP